MNKKSILFIADKPEWAYHNIIKTWAEFLSKDFDCFVAFANDFQINFKPFSNQEYFLSNTFNKISGREKYLKIDSSRKFSYPVYKNPPVYEVASHKKCQIASFDIIVEMAYYLQYIAKFPFKSTKKLVGLYTDSFPHEGPYMDQLNGVNLKTLSREEFYSRYLKPYDGIVVGNMNLFENYSPFTDKLVFANGIFKQNLFVENKKVGEEETLCIGWTGTPDRPMKGFREVIEPAIAQVLETGRKVVLKTKFSGSYEELLQFYKNVDLVVIASEADTGPSLFAEASLSGVPAISTEIGFPKMVIRDGENGIFVKRDIREMRDAIIKLYDDRPLLKKFSTRIKDNYLKLLDNKISIENLKTYFNQL